MAEADDVGGPPGDDGNRHRGTDQPREQDERRHPRGEPHDEPKDLHTPAFARPFKGAPTYALPVEAMLDDELEDFLGSAVWELLGEDW